MVPQVSLLDVFGSAQNPPQKPNSSAPRLDPCRVALGSHSAQHQNQDGHGPGITMSLASPRNFSSPQYMQRMNGFLPRKHQRVRQTDLHESKNTGGDSVILHRTLHLCFDSSTIIFLQTGGCFPNLVTWSFQIQTKDLGLTFLLDWTLRFLWVSPSLVGIHGAVPQPHFFEGNMVVPLGWYPSCLTPQGAL